MNVQMTKQNVDLGTQLLAAKNKQKFKAKKEPSTDAEIKQGADYLRNFAKRFAFCHMLWIPFDASVLAAGSLPPHYDPATRFVELEEDDDEVIATRRLHGVLWSVADALSSGHEDDIADAKTWSLVSASRVLYFLVLIQLSPDPQAATIYPIRNSEQSSQKLCDLTL
jgi:hypothetical protein